MARGALVALAWLLLVGVGVQVARLALVWRRGAPAAVDWRGGLLALPRRYLVDVHAIVARRPAASRMHQAIAGGLLAATLLLLLGAIPALFRSGLYWLLVTVAFAVAGVGAALVRRRRVPVRPAALSGGAFLLLPRYLAAYAGGGLLVALGSGPLGSIGLILAAYGGVGLLAQITAGPMRHAVAGTLHLAAHPRPARFAIASDSAPESALLPIDLTASRLGIGAIEDFAWNRLLGFDACIQCGRCEEACPAFAAGQPLNPKALIQDFCAASRPGSASAYAGSPHPGVTTRGPVLGVLHEETLWACTTCRACVASCPMMIEHVDAVIDIRRHLTLEHGAAPGKADTVLAALRYVGNPSGRAPSQRLDFAAGLKLRVLAPGEAVDVLLWLGDGAFDRRYGATLRALVGIMRAAGLDFAVLGAAEQDCGDLARRLGDEAGFARLAAANVALLATMRFTRIVTADPHALHVLRREYPAFGGQYTVVHHTSLIDDVIAQGQITLAQAGHQPITYHDPCYLGRYNGEIDAPRRVLARLSDGVVEMARSGRNSFCCGGGGGAPVTDIAGKQRIPDLRMAQAAATGASVVAVACPGCTAMLEGVVGPRPVVRDIAELVHEALA
jgi:Fe-S oxidoreductase